MHLGTLNQNRTFYPVLFILHHCSHMSEFYVGSSSCTINFNYLHSQFSIGPSWWHQPWMLGLLWHDCKSPEYGPRNIFKVQVCWVVIIQLKVVFPGKSRSSCALNHSLDILCQHEHTVKSTFVYHRLSSPNGTVPFWSHFMQLLSLFSSALTLSPHLLPSYLPSPHSLLLCSPQSPPKGATIPYRPKPASTPVIFSGGQVRADPLGASTANLSLLLQHQPLPVSVAPGFTHSSSRPSLPCFPEPPHPRLAWNHHRCLLSPTSLSRLNQNWDKYRQQMTTLLISSRLKRRQWVRIGFS